MSYIVGDVHLGRGNKSKNSIYYNNFFRAFDYMIDKMIVHSKKNKNSNNLYIIGDLFEHVAPAPEEYNKCRNVLLKYVDQTNGTIYIIPGNHDYILQRNIINDNGEMVVVKSSACEVLDDGKNIISFIDPQYIEEDDFLLVPYSDIMFDIIDEYPGCSKYLLSHFTTFQMSPYAGKIDEADQMFEKFNKIILGDYHKRYESNKFITAGCPYYRDVDEMINNVSSFLFVDENHDIERIILPELKPLELNSLDENVEPNQIYYIKLTEEMQNDTMRKRYTNVFKKIIRKRKNQEINEVASIEMESNSIAEIATNFIENAFSNMETSRKKLLFNILIGEISLDDIQNKY